MAAKGRKPQKKKAKTRGRRKFLTSVLLIALLAAGVFTLYMHACAKITRISRADVYLKDLPSAFEDTRILFISDLMYSINEFVNAFNIIIKLCYNNYIYVKENFYEK